MKLHVNGTELFFDVAGSELDAATEFRQKPTMLILHGGPGFDHMYLRPWLDPLSRFVRLIYIDQRGCGRSQRHSHEYYQLGIMADDIVRLARFGYQLLVHLCRTHQCELLVMNTEELSPEQELVQDLITITHCFSSRLYGLRNYRKALKKAIADDQSAQDQAPSNN